MTDCVRSITFTIPGKSGVKVKMTEQSDGTILFELETLGGKPADLRGLFFDVQDSSILSKLQFTGTDITSTQVADDQVTDLGHGANMKGKGHPTFDVGVEFGTPGVGHDDITSTSFVLSTNDGTALTLDDLAQVEFGARTTSNGQKLVTVAPAAPDANDDATAIFEDGTSGLDVPSTVPAPVAFQVLSNDTDADGDPLTITDIDDGPSHGTAVVSADGKTVLYTPDEDFSGTDSFVYCITDNNGGTDYAMVNVSVEAVADVPTITYEIVAGSTVNEIIINVTATQTDADSSEFIDRIELSGLPAGVTVVPGSINPGTEPDELTQQFVLTLPLDQDTSFDLNVTAVSKETSNGDEQTGTLLIPIEIDFNSNFFNPTFLATDQSIWDTGGEFVFTDDRFIGLDESFDEGFSAFVFAEVEGSIKAGFQSTLTFEGGDIDASLTYDVTIETNYNKTTDTLLISSDAFVSDGGFTTQGPQGSYLLDFIFNYAFKGSAGLDFLVDDVSLISFDVSDNNTINVLDLNSEDLEIEIPLPLGLTGTIAWPNVSTTASPAGGGDFESDSASNNFLDLNLDVDQALADIFLGGANPFNLSFDVGVAEGTLELLDFDLNAGLNFLQSFLLDEQGLPGVLHFEDGTNQAFTFGSDILLQNASAIDDAGDNDGQVEFTLSLDPEALLNNDTDLGFNVGYNFDLLKISGSYDVGVDSGSFSAGPALDLGGSIPIAAVDIYDNSFSLNFGSQDVVFLA